MKSIEDFWKNIESEYAYVSDENPSIAIEIAKAENSSKFIKDIQDDLIEIRVMDIKNLGTNFYPEITEILTKAGWDTHNFR
ncbi:hypothetical protein SAMN02910293_00486 [Streptococcus henryi]|uniref:Uncharacterized protein n=1 Tax=Streptococcus henryi TaxID=439219 RepID=A0A1G6ALX4_9STRE|nr:hypothetical protein [Streptococcus henryi]SDB09396.1 hypothetical protein SAMN02910293_00486 [Streptococcus henryi]